MTSRRSRLKAVANLPVRRKIPPLPKNDIAPRNNLTPEKISSNSPEGDVNYSNFSTCQNEEAEKITSFENHLQNINGGDKEDILKSSSDLLNHEYPFIKNFVSKPSESNNTDGLENNNEINKNINVNKNNCNNSSSFTCSRRFKPNLISSLMREKAQTKSYKSIESQGFQKQNFSIIDLNSNGINDNSNGNSNIEKDNGKTYTILTPQNEDESSVSTYTITPLIPCKSDATTALSNVYNQPEGEEFEEVQIYTDLGEATDLYVNLPKFVNNNTTENTDFIIESGQAEPMLATLLNSCAKKDLKSSNTNTESNPSKSKNMTPNIFAKPYEKDLSVNGRNNIIGSELLPRNPVAIVRDKPVLGNSNLKVSQNIALDSDSLNMSCKRNVSTLRRKRSKCSDFTKKLADARREFQKKYEKTKPDRSTLKMIDLIFYNPSTNPMVSKTKFEKKEISVGQGELIQELLLEEKIDEPEPKDCDPDLHSTDNSELENSSNMPVPQVKIGLNGEIILDERSLIIETTDAKRGREDLQNSIPVLEDKGSKVSYYRGKTRKTRDWTDFETKRFYKALNTIGPDFSLMQKYFPKRSRLELKNKFKREERLNRNLIDKALNNPSEFDMTQLEKDLAVERKAEEEEVEMRLCKAVKEKHMRKRSKSKSFLSREMVEYEEESDEESENSQLKPVGVNSKRLSQSEKNKKKKEINFIFQKILLKDSDKQINELTELSAPSSCLVQPSGAGVT